MTARRLVDVALIAAGGLLAGLVVLLLVAEDRAGPVALTGADWVFVGALAVAAAAVVFIGLSVLRRW